LSDEEREKKFYNIDVRVAFYGRGFPAFLQNKVFIYRGRGFERLPDFQARMLDQV
jgi:dedicator of cytokinesis protein 1